MTYTLGNTATSAINFASTSTTQQTIDGASKTFGNVTFGSGGSPPNYQLTGVFNQTSGDQSAIVTLSRGTLDVNGQTVSWARFNSSNTATRTLTLGAANITLTNPAGVAVWDTTTVTNLTFNANTSTITLSGANANFVSSTLTFNNVVFTGNQQPVINAGPATFTNLTRTGAATNTSSLSLSSNITVTGTLTLTGGNSTTQRLLLTSNAVGTARTVTAGAVSITNCDFRDITAAGAASPFTGTSIGDAGGNTSITNDTPVTRYWVGNGGNWSNTARWSASSGGASGASVPLVHDTVIFDANSITSGSQTITLDVARKASLDFTNVLNSPALAEPVVTPWGACHGDFILASGMVCSGSGTLTIYSRNDSVIKKNGGTFAFSVSINVPTTITVSLSDAFVATDGSCNFGIVQGIFTTNNFDMTVNTFTIGGSGFVRNVTLGTSTINLSATATTATYWNVSNTTNLTFSGASSTIVIKRAHAGGIITFAGGSLTYGTFTYTIAGSTAGLDITGSNTFNTFNFSDVTNARTVRFTASTTNTFTTFNVNGTSGKLMTIDSITAATHTLSKSSGAVLCDYLSLTNSIAIGGASWYAGANSTNVSGNRGWQFSAQDASKANFFNAFN